MNHKVAEVYDIFIYCKVTFEMQIVDSRKVFFYNCVENVEMKIINVIFIFFIFIVKGVENELILNISENEWLKLISSVK